MNKNEQIIESLNRVKLLMGYKSSMTLTENVENLKGSFIRESIILTEGPSPKVAMQNILKALFGNVDDATRAASIAAGISDAKYLAAKNYVDDAVKKAGGISLSRGVISTNADDIIKALNNGTLGATGVNTLKVGFLKSSITGPELKKVLVDQAATDSRNIAKYQGKTIKEITEDLINKKGYDPTISKQIAKKLHPNLIPVPLVKPTNWRLFSDKIFRWGTLGAILVGLSVIGGVSLAYKFYIESEEVLFPDCIRKKTPEKDFKKMVDQGLDYALITETGNDTIDQYGGGKFFDDKKFVTGNGRYTGTWDDTDSGIVITIGKTDYVMSCEGMTDDGSNTDDDSNTDNNTVIPTTTTTTTIWEPNRTEVDSDEYEK